MPDLNCDTPKDNLKVIPCLQCLTEDQLKLVLMYSMNELFGQYNLPDEVPELLADSACYTCFTQKQLLQLSVTIWATMAFGERGDMTVTIEQIREDLKCLLCANPAQIDAMLAQVSCGIVSYLNN